MNEDTLWEVVTSWQDALSSRDIHLDSDLLTSCANAIHQNVSLAVDDESLLESLEAYAEIVSKLILCSIEHLDHGDDERYRCADNIISTVFNLFRADFESNLAHAHEICVFIDALNGNFITEPSAQLLQDSSLKLGKIPFERTVVHLFKLSMLKFLVVSKATCNIKENRKSLNTTIDSNDEEFTEDYCDLDANLLKKWSKLVIHEILSGIKVSGLGHSLLTVVRVRIIRYLLTLKFSHNNFVTFPFQSESLIENLVLNLQERVALFLTHISKENADTIRDLLLQDKRLKDFLISSSLTALLNIEPYRDSLHGLAMLHNDINTKVNPTDNIESYLNVLQVSLHSEYTSTRGENKLIINFYRSILHQESFSVNWPSAPIHCKRHQNYTIALWDCDI